MTYCLDDDFLKDLLNIRKKYEELKKIKFNDTPQPYAVSCFFGATNVSARDQQTLLIEKMLDALSGELIPPSELEKENFFRVNPKAIEKHVEALRILLTLVFYIKSKVDETYTLLSSKSTTIIKLLDKAMKLKEISIDEETRSTVLHATQKFVNNSKKLEQINEKLQSKITEKEWRDFAVFVNGQCEKIDKKPKPESLPVTSVLVPAFSWPMEMAGYSTGFILGQVIARSTESQPIRAFVTTSLSAFLYFFMGPSGKLGIMLVAPTYGDKLLETFSGVSSSWILGKSMKYAGKGMGYIIGVPIDLGCKAIYHGFTSLFSALSGKKTHHLTGFNLVTGQRVIEGMEVNLINTDEATLQKIFAEQPEEFGETTSTPVQLLSETLVIKQPDGEEIKLPLQPQEDKEKLAEKTPEVTMEELQKLLQKLIKQGAVPLPLVNLANEKETTSETTPSPDGDGKQEVSAELEEGQVASYNV